MQGDKMAPSHSRKSSINAHKRDAASNGNGASPTPSRDNLVTRKNGDKKIRDGDGDNDGGGDRGGGDGREGGDDSGDGDDRPPGGGGGKNGGGKGGNSGGPGGGKKSNNKNEGNFGPDMEGKRKGNGNGNGKNNVSPPEPATIGPPPPPPTPSELPPLEATPPPPPSSILTSSTTSTIPTLTSTASTTSSTETTQLTPVVSIVESTLVVTSMQIATMTSIVAIAPTPLIDPASQPRKGLEPDPTRFQPDPLAVIGPTVGLTTIPVPSSTSTLTSSTTTASAFSDNNGDGKGNGRHNGTKNRDKDPPPGSLSPEAQHALIAVGSIGAFVLACFVAWMVYRTMKKSRSRHDRGFGSGDSRFLNALPWRKIQRNGAWDGRSTYTARGAPPVYEQGEHNSMQDRGFYGQEKKYQQQQPEPGSLTRSDTGGSQRSLLPRLAPGSVVMIPAEQYLAMSQTQSPIGSDQNNTMRSRMPDNFYNQSELARQPSDAYDPQKRQVNRISELSSLSSGFGDGEMVMPDAYLGEPPPAASPPRQSTNFITRFSWMSRREAGNRETVYTTTSEDRPAKYRSIGSWVNQQTGRMKRADERDQAESTVPPVPGIPASVDNSAAPAR